MENTEIPKIKHFNPLPQILILALSIFLFLFFFGISGLGGNLNDFKIEKILLLILSLIGSIYVIISTTIKIKKSDDFSEYILAFFIILFSIAISFASIYSFLN